MGLSRRRLGRGAAALLAAPLLAVRGSSSATEAPALPGVDAIEHGTVRPDFFGMHFHRLVPEPGRVEAGFRWPDLAVGSVRLWDSHTRWADIAPARDQWDFSRLDAYVQAAESRGASILYTLGSTPRWASARPDEPGPYGPGCAAEPASLADWDEYVRRVAARYGTRIAAYEVWNEPYFSDLAADRREPGFFTGSVAQLVAMTRVARVALAGAAPGALLASPGFVYGPERIERYLAAGGAPLIDALAYHFYCADATQFAAEVAQVRRIMAAHAVAHLPFWNTEWGVDRRASSPGAMAAAASARSAAAKLSQFMLLAAAGRLARTYYHAWDNDHTGLVDPAGAATSHRLAYTRTQAWLAGTRVTAAQGLRRGAFRIDAEQGDERRIFSWADTAGAAALPMPPGWRVVAVEPLLGGARVQAAVDGAAIELELDETPVCVRLSRTSLS